MAQKKKNIKQQKQKQKQHQKQQVIVNVITSKSRRSTKKAKGSSSQQQPLTTTLPIQYTPYTMYDTSRILTQENMNRNQIFNPEIPNAIVAEPILTTAYPVNNNERDDVLTAGVNNDFTLNPTVKHNIDYPTQREILKKIQKNNPLPAAVDNSIDNLKKGDDDFNMTEFYSVLTPINARERINPLYDNPTSYRKTEITEEESEEEDNSNLKTDRSSEFYITDENKYYCNICNSSIRNSASSINAHKQTAKHKKQVLTRL